METHNSTTHFSYRIEQKPEGGFIARSSDPGVEAIEGATREEVLQRIQDKAMSPAGQSLGSGFKFGGLQVNLTRKVNVVTSSGTSKVAGEAAGERAAPGGAEEHFSSPIQRSSDTTGTVLRVAAAAIALAALAYYLSHR